MTTRLDLHVHSRASPDARGTIAALADAAKAAGLQGLAVTDHDAVPDEAEIADAAEATGLLMVPGIEVSTIEGHVLGLGVRDAPAKGTSMVEAVAAIEAQGGVAAPSHPLRMFTGVGPTVLRKHATSTLFLCESHNARERSIVQSNTQQLLHDLGLATVGGSDAHWVRDVGTAWTVFDDPVSSVPEVLAALRRGACHGAGGRLPRRQVWRHGASLPFRRLTRRRHD